MKKPQGEREKAEGSVLSGAPPLGHAPGADPFVFHGSTWAVWGEARNLANAWSRVSSPGGLRRCVLSDPPLSCTRLQVQSSGGESCSLT